VRSISTCRIDTGGFFPGADGLFEIEEFTHSKQNNFSIFRLLEPANPCSAPRVKSNPTMKPFWQGFTCHDGLEHIYVRPADFIGLLYLNWIPIVHECNLIGS
jgi:hypothetical protein